MGQKGADDILREANEKLVLAALHSQERAESSAKEEVIFNALPDVVARFDRERKLVYVNTSAERLTGRSRTELLTKTREELGVSAAVAAQWDRFLGDAFARGISAEKLFAFDGRTFHVRTVPEPGPDGAIGSVVAIAREVTDSELHRRARADADRLQRLQAITAAFSEAPTPRDIAQVLVAQAHEALQADAAVVMLLDDTDRTLELAAAVGYPDGVLDRWSALPLDADAPLPEAARTQEPLFFSSHDRVSERYPAIADGRYDRDEALAAIPLTFKRRSFGAVALVFRSRQEFAEADRAFIASLAECAAQAIERAGLLQAERLARQDAEAANRLKDEFLATMSHELRTPLHSVMGWATLLRNTTLDAATSRRAIDAIERNARHQTRLVDDILDVSRIIGGRLRLDIQPTEVATVVGLAVDVVRPAAEAKHINLCLALGDAGMIAADAARLQQVVWNLVSNAVKFTPEGGQIDISVRRRQGNIAIVVTDTGVGIAPAFLPHVFDRFRQFDGATTRRQGGLGLGLAIVRHLVELHGGSVAAHSEGQMRGATFTVTLPASLVCEAATVAAPAHQARAANVPVTPVDLEGLRVLVVDDDDDSRSMLCTALSSCGAEVASSSSAEAGLAQAASIRPDLLVCDIAMPGMDGYALIRQVRTWPDSAGGRTPAIALTGFARDEDVTRALEAGFQEHAAKPVDLGRFTRTVARLVGRTVGTHPTVDPA